MIFFFFFGELGFLAIEKVNVNGIELAFLLIEINIFSIETGTSHTKIDLNNLHHQIFNKYVMNINN